MNDRAKGRAVIVGRIEVVEDGGKNYKHPMALLIVFDSADQVRKALVDGVCSFTFGDAPKLGSEPQPSGSAAKG